MNFKDLFVAKFLNTIFSVNFGDGHTVVRICGVKLSFKNNLFVNRGNNKVIKGKGVRLKGQCLGDNNTIILGKNTSRKNIISISVEGNGNEIILEDCDCGQNIIKFFIHGDNNKVTIGKNYQCLGFDLAIGSSVKINNATVSIGEGFSSCKDLSIVAYQHNIPIVIGKNCMFSNSITIRSGEIPHMIFNSVTGESMDCSKGVFIGEHVWIGEKVFIMKNASIADECIVGAASVVTKHFDQKNVVIAGSPARIVKENVAWAGDEQGKVEMIKSKTAKIV